MNGSLFRRADDYGGGFRDQRTKQSEMDSLMQMSLEYAGNNDDEDDQKNKEADDDQIDTSDLFKSLEYRREKVQKGGSNPLDVYSARIRATNNTSTAANNRRYQGNRGYGDSSNEQNCNDDDGGFQSNNGYSRDARRNEDDDDDDDDELDRGGDPLSLEELDGWMNQINNQAAAAQTVMPAAATVPLDDAPSPGQQAEVDYLRKELGDLGVAHPDLTGFQAGGDAKPFDLYPAQQNQQDCEDAEEDEDDELGLDLIAQVQQAKTSLRASLAKEQQSENSNVHDEF